jgi:hypothetical protein
MTIRSPLTAKSCPSRRQAAPGSTQSVGGRWFVVVIVLAALIGAWLGHLLEYIRVAGVRAGVGSITTSVHLYMLPAGLALLAGATTVGAVAAWAWVRLARRLAAARRALKRRPRARPASGGAAGTTVRGRALALPAPNGPARLLDPTGRSSFGGLASLWLLLTLLQVTTWVVQENVELSASGLPMPGAGVLGGVHALAPVVQAGVALGLAALIVGLQRRFARRVRQVRAHERLLAERWPLVLVFVPAVLASRSATPLERWGAQRWLRPPPVLFAF